MESFFDTIYNWTRWLYSDLLDNYLYETIRGYYQIGIITVSVSLFISFLFYYLLKPVRKQTAQWFMSYGIAAVINFLVSLCYTQTPLVNNLIPEDDRWTTLDCVMFGVADVFWTLVFFTVAALIFKWGSINKYVPFQKF